MVTRKDFLRTLLGGIAAAPVIVSAAPGGLLVSEIREVTSKRWTHDGMDFAEWTFPISIPPMFESAEADKLLHQMTSVVEDRGDGMTRRFLAPRRVIVPVFDGREFGESAINVIAEKVVETYLKNQPVERFGNNPVGFNPKREMPKHLVVVRVAERPHLLGMMAAQEELVPVKDFYRGV